MILGLEICLKERPGNPLELRLSSGPEMVQNVCLMEARAFICSGASVLWKNVFVYYLVHPFYGSMCFGAPILWQHAFLSVLVHLFYGSTCF